jgi:hypothetical protein
MSYTAADVAFVHDAVERGRRTYEQYVGLPPGVLTRIYAADDWTFALQVYAMLEIAVDQIILRDAPDLTREWLMNCDFRNEKNGRVSYGVAHGTISTGERTAIGAVAKLRNRYVHDLRNAVVPLTDYLRNDPVGKEIANELAKSNMLVGRDAREWLLMEPRSSLMLIVGKFMNRVVDSEVERQHGLGFTSKDGRVLVTEDAPRRPPIADE